jgi:hypothetical protein
MSNTWQYIIVGIVVALAFFLSARSIYRAINNKKSALNSCDSCQLKEICNKNKPQKDCNKNTIDS